MRFKNPCFIKFLFDINILRICLYLASIKEIQVNLKQNRNTYILYTYIAIFTETENYRKLRFHHRKLRFHHQLMFIFLKINNCCMKMGMIMHAFSGFIDQVSQKRKEKMVQADIPLGRCIRSPGHSCWSFPCSFPFHSEDFYSEKNDPYSMKFI